jgi:hypothetical protein
MEDKLKKDLKEIRDIMNRASRFISLSGLSGVSTGITALIGVYLTHYLIFRHRDYLVYNRVELDSGHLLHIILIALGTLLVSIATAIFFTSRKTKNQNLPIWDIQTKRLLINLSIPLITGGLLCLMLLLKGFVGILPSLTLIFYGLALVNGSKYTLNEIRNLGIFQIILGLIAFQFIQYGLLFWALGFGVIQIVYGLIIHRKY